MYEIPAATSDIQRAPIRVVEYTPQFYAQADLDFFFSNFTFSSSKALATCLCLIKNPTFARGTSGEAGLELEYVVAPVNPITVTLYHVGGKQMGASPKNFLDVIDTSYCTSGGGDDTTHVYNFT